MQIFSPLALGPDDLGLFSVDFPLVVLGERVFGAPADHVTMNNVAAAKAATLHLAALGRRRIAVLGAHGGERVGSAALAKEIAAGNLPAGPGRGALADAFTSAWHIALWWVAGACVAGAAVVTAMLSGRSGAAADAAEPSGSPTAARSASLGSGVR